MVGSFNGLTITFNGINSSRFGLYLCTTESKKDRTIGVQQSVETESSEHDVQIFKRLKKTTPTVQLQLVKMDRHANPLPISEDDMFEINRWLFSHEQYKPLIIDHKDVVYYGVFVKGSANQNEAREGYLTLNFQLSAPYGYSVVQNSDVRVNGDKTVILKSKHNACLYNEVDIEFKLNDGETSITIENQTTGQVMTFKNLDHTCRHVYVYNDGMKHAISKTNPEVNLRNRFNRVFIRLAYGKNVIRIQGNGQVRFISQAKVLIQ